MRQFWLLVANALFGVALLFAQAVGSQNTGASAGGNRETGSGVILNHVGGAAHLSTRSKFGRKLTPPAVQRPGTAEGPASLLNQPAVWRASDIEAVGIRKLCIYE